VIGLRIDGEEIWLEPEEWELWLQDGRIPPRAWVQVRGRWVRVTELSEYRLRPAPVVVPARPRPSLQAILFPRRGLSATETLVLINVVVAVVLLIAWKDVYRSRLLQLSMGGWHQVRLDHAYWWWLITIFVHAGPGHLGRNMVSLLAGAGAVEFLCGRRWTVLVYLVTGMVGMAASFLGHDGPPLSVGASGAVYGLAGCALGFILRRRGWFSYRQRWKAMRVYVPLFVILYIPSLLRADYLAHVGGLISGLVFGLLIPPHARVRALVESERMPGPDET
jgi:rhomboid protease GluP